MRDEMIADKRVLIVEDDYFSAREMAECFEEIGAQVVGPAPSVAVALELLSDRLPDVAVLDVLLGKETVGPIAELLSDHGVPFVYATAYASSIGRTHRAAKVFEKPILLSELARSVAEIVRNAATGRSYGVHRIGGNQWEWRVYIDGRVVHRGLEASSLHARVAALTRLQELALN